MKSRKLALGICGTIVVLVGLSSIGLAQNRERFGISAKAGGVNAVLGRVMVTRSGQAPQLLTSQDDLVAGDVVTTGVGSKVEVLLNPGSYLRVAENSEFVLVDNSLDNLLVKLVKGSAIVEATGMGSLELQIAIATNTQRMTIVRPGIYRINAQRGATDLVVRKGRVALSNDPKDVVKGGKKLTFAGGLTLVAKLDKHDNDEFDNWSKERGETLARANQRLSARTLNGYLSANSFGWPNAGFGRYGVWTWSPILRCNTFLPFYFGWSSPYGQYYGYSLGGFYGGGCCGQRPYNQPVNNATSGGYSTGSSGGSSGGTSGGSSGGSSGGYGGQTSGGTSTPSSRPPSQAGPRDPDSGSRSINRIKDP
jgi:uncharacterized membrane protein YgcG